MKLTKLQRACKQAMKAEATGLSAALRNVLELNESVTIDSTVREWSIRFVKCFGLSAASLSKANKAATRGRIIKCIPYMCDMICPCELLPIKDTGAYKRHSLSWIDALVTIDLNKEEAAKEARNVIANEKASEEEKAEAEEALKENTITTVNVLSAAEYYDATGKAANVKAYMEAEAEAKKQKQLDNAKKLLKEAEAEEALKAEEAEKLEKLYKENEARKEAAKLEKARKEAEAKRKEAARKAAETRKRNKEAKEAEKAASETK
jgi:chemotaxis protein histidine kinase CheA